MELGRVDGGNCISGTVTGICYGLVFGETMRRSKIDTLDLYKDCTKYDDMIRFETYYLTS